MKNVISPGVTEFLDGMDFGQYTGLVYYHATRRNSECSIETLPVPLETTTGSASGRTFQPVETFYETLYVLLILPVDLVV